MKLLIPTSGEEAAKDIATYMIGIAKRMSADVATVHILRDGETEQDGLKACGVFEKIGELSSVKVSSYVARGDVIDAIVRTAESTAADLILMGASHGKLVENWLSADVMQRCEVPVLVVPHCYVASSP